MSRFKIWRFRSCSFVLAVWSCLLQAQTQVAISANDMLRVETSQFRHTGTYAEVENLCQSWAQRYPDVVRCLNMGATAEGRIMRAIVVTRTGALTPEQAEQANVPVVLAIAGTHAGEIDGKDAGLMLIRDWLKKPPSNDPLQHQVLLFVPVFNIDGHERPSPYNRPNQNGPALQGERVTAQRINLNRDWMLVQTPEMSAMMQLINQWDPLVMLDLHVTDGVRFRHDVSLSMSPMFGTDEAMQTASDKFGADLSKRLKSKGHTPLDFMPVLLDLENPRAGIMRDADAPRFSHVYAALRNRIGILVEDHAWDPYATRIKTSRDVVVSTLELVARQGKQLLKVANQADENAKGLGGDVVALDWHNTLETGIDIPTGQIDLLGYAYTTHTDAPVVGGRYVTYHTDQPEVWTVPVYNDIQPINETIVTLPQGGYVVPAGWAGNVLPYLQKHGISYQVLAKPAGQVEVQEMRVAQDAVSFDSRTFQGRVRTYITGEWVRTQVNLPKGSLFVPMRQAHALLAAHLFEPVSPDSLSSWGLFNTAYEVTDHIASHRQLQLVQWMYTQDERIRQNYGDSLHRKLPSLRQEYQRRLDRDDRFRDDPEQRMEFWMSQIPYHDPTYHKYPVLRTDRMFTGIKGQ